MLFATTQIIMSVIPDRLKEIKCLVKSQLKKKKAEHFCSDKND